MITLLKSTNKKSHQTKNNTDFSKHISVNETGRTRLSNQLKYPFHYHFPFRVAGHNYCGLWGNEIFGIAVSFPDRGVVFSASDRQR